MTEDNKARNDSKGPKKLNSVGLSRVEPCEIVQQSPLCTKNANSVGSGCKEKSSVKKSPRSKIKLRSSKLGRNTPRKTTKLGSFVMQGCNSGVKSIKMVKSEVELDKKDKNMSAKKKKSIKSYFESLIVKEKPEVALADIPVETIGAVQVDDSACVPTNTSKESVKEKINVFELMMQSKGDTPLKTPKGRVKRIGGGKVKRR